MIQVFDGDDSIYQAWLSAHPDGYVLNARRNLSPNYMVLHKASCEMISNYGEMSKKGGFTERSFIKVCGPTIGALRDWVCKHGRADRTFSNECSLCNK